MVGLLLGCYCCWNGSTSKYTRFITDTVNSFSNLVDDIILLHHEAAKFSNFVIRFLDIVCNWSCREFEHGKIELAIFVEVCDESRLGFVGYILCLPLEYCFVEDS